VKISSLSRSLFKMYRSSIVGDHCSRCRESGRQRRRNRVGPVSFWHVGRKFSNTQSVRIAFVGKTSWAEREDLHELRKKGPIWDGTSWFDYFWNDSPRWSPYWRCVRDITERLGLGPNNLFITNLAKCNVRRRGYRRYTDVTDLTYYQSCIDLFEKEIEIVQPSHIVLLTGSRFDSLIGSLRFGFVGYNCEHRDVTSAHFSKEIGRKSIPWWHRTFLRDRIPRTQFLRTRHPQGAPAQLADEIVSWIDSTRSP